MAYSAPTITAAGLTVPTYQDILNDLIDKFKAIYGQNVYLAVDSADYQLLSVLSLKMADTVQLLQLIYNNRAPVSAVGAALDAIVKLNGIARKSATSSTCTVTLTGAPGTVILGGIVQDINGFKWDLPDSVTIGVGGTVDVLATCETTGAVTADPNTLTTIVTPAAGWTSVTNAAAALVGQAVESDSALRARQAISTALPSITMLAGTIAAIAAVPGVTRYNVLENPTGAVDAYGTPPHSITAVVEGGTDAAVAQAIYNNRGDGAYTNGTTVVTVVDPVNGGISMPIRFDRPTYVSIYVILNVHALSGYTSATTGAIRQAVTDYLNSLKIGELLTISGMYGAALAVMPDLKVPLFSIRAVFADVTPAPVVSNDITMNFNEVTQGILANVTVNLV